MKRLKTVLDTNTLLSDGTLLKNLPHQDVVIPFVVLQELDKFKGEFGEIGVNAREAIRFLSGLLKVGNLFEGVDVDTATYFVANLDDASELSPDDFIIGVAKVLFDKELNVRLLSNDLNVQIKASSFGIPVEGHDKSKMLDHLDEVYGGIQQMEVSAEMINGLHSTGIIMDDLELYENEYVNFRNELNRQQSAIGRCEKGRIVRITPEKNVFGLKPRNLEQVCAIDAILNTKTPLVSLVGKAGGGKTLLALACALELVIQRKEYAKIVVIKPVVDMGKGIGFMPGPQPLDAKIATPKGWTTMGQLSPGDIIFDRMGQPTSVVEIFPKGDKKVFRIETSDGKATEACEDHLWLTQTWEENKRGKAGKIRTTREIMDTLKTSKNRLNHYLPFNGTVAYDKQELPIPPYTMGVLLGDGCLRSEGMSFASIDEDIVSKVKSELNQLGADVNDFNEDQISYHIRSLHKLENNKPQQALKITNLSTGQIKIYQGIAEAAQDLNTNKTTLRSRCMSKNPVFGFQYDLIPAQVYWTNPLKNEIHFLGLEGLKAWEKYIPNQYKFGSVQDRLEVIRGLMDTDGTVKKNGEYSFCSTSKQLAQDVIEVVRSLGGRAKLPAPRNRIGKKSQIKDKHITSSRRISYEFTVSMPNDMNPFYLERKASRVKNKLQKKSCIITNIVEVGIKPVQCILVDNEEHLYITDDFIITHNTLQEKMEVWAGSVLDNFEVLLSANGKINLDMMLENGTISIVPPTHMRGRSLGKTIVILDEAQNMSAHEVKTIVTRMGEESKLIVTGDIYQIDNMRISGFDNGLTRLVEVFKQEPLAAHITLQHCERSTLSARAAEIM